MKKKKDYCEICGEELVYVTQIEDYKKLYCEFCKTTDFVNVFCQNDHYICDQCHSKDPIKIITDFCENTKIKDPFEIVDQIMRHPKFKMYGPEHHALSTAAILTMLKNNGIKRPNGEPLTQSDIIEGIKRSAKIPGGWCGFYGACGAGIGSGVAISIFTKATPATNKPRTLANQITSRSLKKISDNLEHCCKRSVRYAIITTLEFLKEKFNVDLNYSSKKCIFSNYNDKCEKNKCPIY